MFTNHLPDNEDYQVVFSEYAKRHFLKDFVKKYRGKRWEVTQESIKQNLRRIRALQDTQQVNELRWSGKLWLFKYDFAVAQTNISPKASGNRCLVFLDATRHLQTILLIHHKSHLPEKKGETAYLLQTAKEQFSGFWEKLKNQK
ncbi:MAG: hypothetical protein OXF30_00540 [Candidatus Saccharibacteria bacterium]|nr:hypothetical protein [Candidatus Saccharibacteria bacterium]